MNREDIIRMAREAGLPRLEETDEIFCLPSAICFAALVAAAEREKVAEWMMQRSYATGHGETIEDLLAELGWQIRESEREACAKTATTTLLHHPDLGDAVAAAIRARGEQQ